ncbi:ribosomal protein S18-alanine N-acetyltransferase [Geoglobus acetivorans]|uniref:Ribosomal protein S18-alanine N-acetyltransferase n=1 Tax=Geoglobus acetivorans TaxID=565033 RepID=A0ABZ3H6F5_GEOAI|nr:ribosomal protein S18-alanine N-acetyltransferase [Geoglobus acetivorans]
MASVYSILIRPFEARDSSDIIRIDAESFNTRNPTYDLFVYLAYGSEIIVADMGSMVVGYVVLSYRNEEAKIMSIAVKKEFRRRGIGKILLREAIQRAKKRGMRKILLEVRESNVPAQNLYKKFGFEVAGYLESYYSDGEAAYLMNLDLDKADDLSKSRVGEQV